jgi:hypothetical protein
MPLTHDEKLKLMSNLNWDYLDTHDDMLAVIEGRLERSGAFTQDKLFVCSLERLPWHYVTALWGVEKIKELYTPEIANRIWPKERRYYFDFALAVLRREPLPVPKYWGEIHHTIHPSERFYQFEEYALLTSEYDERRNSTYRNSITILKKDR